MKNLSDGFIEKILKSMIDVKPVYEFSDKDLNVIEGINVIGHKISNRHLFIQLEYPEGIDIHETIFRLDMYDRENGELILWKEIAPEDWHGDILFVVRFVDA